MRNERSKGRHYGFKGRNAYGGGQREHLTPMQERLLGYIAFRTVGRDGTSESKRQLAEHLRSSTKTVDRAITRLCNEGYIEVEENLLPDGRQGPNTYRLSR